MMKAIGTIKAGVKHTMIGQILQNRYVIEDEIGRGGMGVIYKAQDSLLKREVAIKVISDSSGLGSTGKARLLAEAQATARLNHPNIVSVYDAGEVGDLTYLVMELVEGQSLRQVQGLPLPQVLDIAIQVCGALEQAHAAGIIHRDLKPENILLTPSKIAKLMDFGLARRIDTPQLTEEGTIIGSFAYIAPEIISGGMASPQSDLYAFGLILYEMTTGRPAYSGQDLLTILSQHLHATVEPPSTHNPNISTSLEALILRLLEKQPTDRPASAADVRASLEVLRTGGSPEALEAAVGGAPLDRMVRGRLVAREDELCEAIEFWKRAQLGESRVLLISGEPGIGKTRLVRELATRIGLTGGLVLSGESDSQGGAPYSPIAQMVEQADLSDLPDLVLADLCALDPALGLRMPDMPPNPALDPQAEQQRLLEAFALLCSHLTQRAPLLVVLDDAHWADGGSLSMLRHLARRARRMKWPVLLALTYREVELTEARFLNDLLAELNRERLAERIKLNRFSREQTAALLAAIFAEQVSDEFCDGIYQETEGNPFFVEEVCKALIDAGLIYRQDGHWERAEMKDMHVPQSVRLAIEGRISRLPEPVQETLRMAAVLGRRFDFETLQEASGQDEDDLIDMLERAERLQLISEVGSAGGGAFSFTHALIPATLVDDLSGLRQRRLHRKALETIAHLHPDDYETLAYHCVQAADDALALEYYRKAGQRAQRLYAGQDAVRLYSEALQLLPEPTQERFKLLEARANVYDLLANRPAQLTDLQEMLQIARNLDDQERECDTLIALTGYYLETDQPQAAQPAEQALALARQLQDQGREGRALSVLARYTMFSELDSLRARTLYEQANTCLEAAGDDLAIAFNLNALALLEGRLGNFDQAQRWLEQAVALSRQVGNRRVEALNLRRMATNLIFMGRQAEAMGYARQAHELFRQIGDRSGECHCLNVLGLCSDGVDKLEEARSYFEQAIAVGEEIDLTLGILYPVENMLGYYPRLGELEANLAFIGKQLSRPQFTADANIQAELLGLKAQALAALGRSAEALEIAQELLERSMEQSSVEVQIRALGQVATLLIDLGRWDEASLITERLLSLGQQTGEDRLQYYPYWILAYYNMRLGRPETWRQAVEYVDRILSGLTEDESQTDTRVESLSIKAFCLSQLGEHVEALEVIKPLREHLEKHHRPDRFSIYLACGFTLHLTGQLDEARQYIQPAYDYVMNAASKISDPQRRQLYLDSFLPHMILEEAAALGITKEHNHGS
jgi:predicted ATPase